MGGRSLAEGERTRPVREYGEESRSPLWWMLGYLAFIGVLVLVGYSGVVGISRASSSTVSDETFAGGLVALSVIGRVLWLISLAFLLAWLYQIGRNGGTYGLGVLAAVGFLWPIPIFLLLVSPGLALLATVAYIAWPVNMLVTGIWRAANLPRGYSMLGWAPLLLVLVLLALAAIVDLGEGGALVIAVIVFGLLGVATVFNVAAVFTVTILQHLGIAKDRRLRREYLEAMRPEPARGLQRPF